MFVLDEGKGPAVLLLHGAPSTTAHLRPLADALVRTRRVLIPDLPGYGRTRPLDGKYDHARAHAMLEALLLERGILEVAVVGHSMGGWRAMALALSTRIRVTHVASLGGFATVDDDMRAGVAQNATLFETGFDFDPVIMSVLAAPGFEKRRPAEAAEMRTWTKAAPGSVIAGELRALLANEDLSPRLSSLSIPVLARVGALDVAVPPRLSEAIARLVPTARLEIVPGCGHALLYEDAAGTIASVESLLASAAA